MIRLKISNSKDFMQKLLLSELFDEWQFMSGMVTTAFSYTMDGRLQGDFFEKEEVPDTEFVSWQLARTSVFSMIKGKRLPLSMKLVLGKQPDLPSEIRYFQCTISYEAGDIYITTGASYAVFTLDKSGEEALETKLKLFLEEKEIAYMIL